MPENIHSAPTEIDDARHLETGAGVARGKVEEAYHQAHGNHGRNLARRLIDREISRADAVLADPDRRDTGETLPTLATTIGETRHGKYLIPFSHAVSPLAAPHNGETGETTARHNQETGLASLATPLKGGESGETLASDTETTP